MKTLYPFTLFLSALVIMGCTPKPNTPALPPATQTGENTFGCVLDTMGIYIPKRSIYFQAYNGIGYYAPSGSLSIQSHNSKDFNARVILNLGVDSLFGVGFNPYLNQNNTSISLHRFDTDDYYFYELDSNAFNWVSISKLDTITPIISGSFAFTVIDYSKQDTLHISDGRFDFSNVIIH